MCKTLGFVPDSSSLRVGGQQPHFDSREGFRLSDSVWHNAHTDGHVAADHSGLHGGTY